MAWILKRAAVLLATLIMITSCAGSDQSTPPPKTTAALAFSQSEATGIAMAPKLAQDNVADWREDGVVAGAFVSRNGWAYTIKAGSYGSDYRQRAFVTEVGVGANLPEDAVYPMYGSDDFFVDNPLNRYTLSARDTFIENPDGSTDIYIQSDSPGPDKEANWLPAGRDVAHPAGQAPAVHMRALNLVGVDEFVARHQVFDRLVDAATEVRHQLGGRCHRHPEAVPGEPLADRFAVLEVPQIVGPGDFASRLDFGHHAADPIHPRAPLGP